LIVGGQVDAPAHPVEGAAAADVGDGGVDVGVGRGGFSASRAAAVMMMPGWQ
jgi:hypothetical protein